MSERREVSWRDRYPEEVTCVRCLEVCAVEDLDRLLWCPDCRRRAARRADRRGWIGGAVIAALLALWIWLDIRPDRDLIIGGWIATVVAAFWIGSRVVRELAYGVERFQNRRAVEAVPPTEAPGVEPREKGDAEPPGESAEGNGGVA